MLEIDFYKNKNQESRQFGKVYGRVHNKEPWEIDRLAEHIAVHGSPYTRDVIYAVLLKAADCIKHLVLEGQPVKLSDLCIFKATAVSTPAQSAEKFDLATNITAIRLGCRATGATRIANMREDVQLAYTSLAQRIKDGEAELSNEKGKYLVPTQG
ncbi:MAG: DNA-binding protein [Prevotella sp.]|nr:DNA-binding protein [Prevotella sp.]MBQ8713450.1 DNA-binding protein [Prevotella sp.]